MIADNPAPRAGMSTQHTATPWTQRSAGSRSPGRFVESANGTEVARLIQAGPLQSEASALNQANAAFIVRACNAHDALLAALRDLLGAYRMANRDAGYEEAADGVEQRAAAVIAQEEGK